MIVFYRIFPEAYLPDDPTREAQSSEGRWHAPGQRVLYFASSLALSILELHANALPFPHIREHCRFSRVEVAPERILRVPESFYRGDWTWDKKISRAYGSDWYANRRSLVLEVKSAVVQAERNYVINTEHADFPALAFAPPSPVPLDVRLG